MGTTFWIIPMLALNLSWGEVELRPVGWHVSKDVPSDEVDQDSTQIKLSIRQDSVTVFYKLDEKRVSNWKYLWMSDGTGARTKTLFSLPAGKYQFRCEKGGHEQLVTSQELSGGHFMEFVVNVYKPNPDKNMITRKPAIYLYNPEPMDVHIDVEPEGEFTFCYPAYKDGWDVSVQPDGQLLVDGNTYDYLFWEGKRSNIAMDNLSGFVVSREEVVPFLEETLDQLGFNAREQNDFIAYWGPELARNPYNQIHFVMNERYEDMVGAMETSVEPDALLRVFMLYQSLEEPIYVTPQVLPEPLDRTGFTVVEWGGGESTQMKNTP